MKREKSMTGKKSGAGKNHHPIQNSRSYIKQEYQSRLWRCGEGEHLIDIIPYLAWENHPILEKGEVDFDLDFIFHRWVGSEEDSFICLSRMFKKPCPICEEVHERRKSTQFDPEELRSFFPIRRVLYNILVHDNIEEERAGVRLWDISYYWMARPLLSMSLVTDGSRIDRILSPVQKRRKKYFFRPQRE